MSDLISRATLLKELRHEQRECEKDGEEVGGESILFAEAFGDVIEMVKRMPAADAVPAEKYDMLVRRIQHLLESDYICSFDEKDFRTGEYKRDIREATAPVVRCRDCKHRGTDYCPMLQEVEDYDEDAGWDYRYVDNTDDDGYCHMGSKMDGGDTDG